MNPKSGGVVAHAGPSCGSHEVHLAQEDVFQGFVGAHQVEGWLGGLPAFDIVGALPVNRHCPPVAAFTRKPKLIATGSLVLPI